MSQNSNDCIGQKVAVVWLSVTVAFFLTLFKVVVAFLTNSMSILASATDSFMDFFMSAVNLFAS